MVGKRFNCTLPTEVYDELVKEAKQQHMSKSRLVAKRLVSSKPEILNLGPVAEELYKLNCAISSSETTNKELSEAAQMATQVMSRFIRKWRPRK